MIVRDYFSNYLGWKNEKKKNEETKTTTKKKRTKTETNKQKNLSQLKSTKSPI